jgi:hypothetical protein
MESCGATEKTSLSRLLANYFSPADLSWWAWILLAAVLWFLQLLISGLTDETIRQNKQTNVFWGIRATLLVGVVVSALVGVIRFVKWVWNS